MNKLLPLAAALCLSACGAGDPGSGEPPLAGARIGGAFTLVDQDGRAVSDRSYPGKWRTMYFGYSFCPDVCPVDLQRLMQGYHLFAKDDPERAAKLQPVFVTIDPERDTAPVLKQYVAAFGAPLVGLTGTPAQVAAAAKAYAVYYARREDPGASAYLMDHARATTLFDPAGRPVALIPTDQSAEAVAQELAKWVR